MRLVINNPVTNSPWTPKMPNNFRGSHAAAKKLPEPADPKVKTISRRPSQRPRKPSPKLQITQIYHEQLLPLYPYLSKTQVRAAITLANNNLHQSRLFLDLANKFAKLPCLNLGLNFLFKRPSNSPEESSTNDDNFTTVLQSSSSVSSVSNKSQNDKSGQEGLSGNFSTSDNSSSSVFDFSDAECTSEPIQSWSSHRMQLAKKKIGVSIIRSSKGYKSFLL